MFSSVLLPAPLLPYMVIMSPSLMLNDIPFIILFPLNYLCMFIIFIIVLSVYNYFATFLLLFAYFI